MAQQPQVTSQVVFGPANTAGDILHFINSSNTLQGWVDKNQATAGVSFVVNGLQPSAAATITAAVGGVFSYTSNGLQVSVNAPGGGAIDQIPFTIKAGGYINLAAGTYTATVQPLLYASTTSGFTAAASNAIFSAAGVVLTMTSVAATPIAWELESHLIVDSVSGKVQGWNQGALPTTSTGTSLSSAITSPTIISNAPTSGTPSAAVPLQFGFGITLAGTASAAPVLALGSLFLES